MGADNWTYCPKCRKQRIDDLEKAQDIVDNQYGKVAQKEYEDAVNLLNGSLVENEVHMTLREDYEQGIHDGEYYLSYRAYCSKCNWKYSKEIEEKLDIE